MTEMRTDLATSPFESTCEYLWTAATCGVMAGRTPARRTDCHTKVDDLMGIIPFGGVYLAP